MSVSGFSCSDYDGTDLETVFETALENTWSADGQSSTAIVTANGCTDASRRRELLTSSSVDLAFVFAIFAASDDTVADDTVTFTVVADVLDTAVSDGSFASTLSSVASDQGYTDVSTSSISVTDVDSNTFEPTMLPTPSPTQTPTSSQPTQTPSAAPTITSVPTTPVPVPKSDDTDDALAVGLGVGLGGGGGLCILLAIAFLLYRKKQQEKAAADAAAESPGEGEMVENPNFDPNDLVDTDLIEVEAQDRAFALGEVMEA